MRGVWARVATRVDKMSLRERLSIFAALVVLILALGDALLIDPLWSKHALMRRDLAQRQSEISALQGQIQTLATSREASPDRTLRDRLERVRRDTASAEARIGEAQKRFTRPDQMRMVLEEILGRNRKIALVDMKTLQSAPLSQVVALLSQAATMLSQPATALLSQSSALLSQQPTTTPSQPAVPTKPAGDGAKPPSRGVLGESVVYRHSIEFTVSGSYFDLLTYLSELERLPTRLYWGGAELDASAYPVLRMKLVVFTLSLDKAWMSL